MYYYGITHTYTHAQRVVQYNITARDFSDVNSNRIGIWLFPLFLLINIYKTRKWGRERERERENQNTLLLYWNLLHSIIIIIP